MNAHTGDYTQKGCKPRLIFPEFPLAGLVPTVHNNDMNNLARYILGIAVLYLFASAATAHPIPKDSHDRTIVVALAKRGRGEQASRALEYRLEVDETTVIRNDMTPFKDEINVLDYRNRLPEYYAEFAKKFATIFAERLIARRTDKKQDVEFRCLSHKERLQDEDGKNLGHLRCDFVFEGTLDIDPTRKPRSFFAKTIICWRRGRSS